VFSMGLLAAQAADAHERQSQGRSAEHWNNARGRHAGAQPTGDFMLGDVQASVPPHRSGEIGALQLPLRRLM